MADGDLHFLCRLYASTRAEEVATTGWPEETQQQFLVQQFGCQHRYYQEHYADAEFMVLLQDDQPIGRLYWQARPTQAILIDISLLPAYRGLGLGSVVMSRLATQADLDQRPIDLHVEPANPARRLYERLAFTTVDTNGVYLKMRRTPRPPCPPGATP